MTRTVTIDGLRELEINLATLTRATGRNVLKRGLQKGGVPLAEDMADRAPEDDGDLKRSIASSTRKPHNHKSAGKQAFAEAMRAGADRQAAGAAAREANRANPSHFAEAFVGPGRLAQATQQEFGNENHGPQPYVRPAWDAGQDATRDRVVAEITGELDKAIARAAKATAR